MIQSFSDTDLIEQKILDNSYWILIQPKNPVYKYHLMMTPKRKEAHIFTELTIEELAAMRDLVQHVIESFQHDSNFKYSGYNLFCNCGGEQVGQHVNQFHMHLFVRSFKEENSPYDLMNQNKRWVNKGTAEWDEHRVSLIEMLSE